VIFRFQKRIPQRDVRVHILGTAIKETS
jgi:hypothetical protein